MKGKELEDKPRTRGSFPYSTGSWKKKVKQGLC